MQGANAGSKCREQMPFKGISDGMTREGLRSLHGVDFILFHLFLRCGRLDLMLGWVGLASHGELWCCAARRGGQDR